MPGLRPLKRYIIIKMHMKKNINQYPDFFFFIFISLAICLISQTNANANEQGEIISRVNLRQVPDLQGKIITGLQEGALVVVKDQKSDWYKIYISFETYGYEGWVYGKYIRIIPETDMQNGSMEFMKTPADAVIPNQNNIKKPADLQNTEQIDAVETPNKPIFLNNYKPDLSSGTRAPLIMPIEKAPLISNINKHPQKNSGWLRSALKLASIILSCCAIILAFKALQSTRETRAMVIDLKDNLDQ